MELLQGEKSAAQVAKAYGVHPNTVNNWKQKLLDDGAEVYAKDGAVAEYERRIADLEQLLGKKEVEIAPFKKTGSDGGTEHRGKSGFRRIGSRRIQFEHGPFCG
jgi:transposase-like protein